MIAKCECGQTIHLGHNVTRFRCPCGKWLGEPKPLPATPEWPAWAKAIARWKKQGDTGVGDTFHRIAQKTGAESVARLAKWFGINCGCEMRQFDWNNRFPYDLPPI